MDNNKPYLEALEADRSGDWEKAHEIVQDLGTKDASWIHAYLHRKEGDQGNALFWYNRAGKTPCNSSINEEWQKLWDHFSNEN